MHWLRRIVLVGLIVGLILASHFFVQNNETRVSIDFAAVRFENVALWLVLVCTFGAGLAVAMAVAVLRGARLRMETRRYRKAAHKLEAEVHELRTLPLAPAAEPAELPSAAAEDGFERGG